MLLGWYSAILCLAAESSNLLLECHSYWHIVKIRKEFVSELIGFLMSVLEGMFLYCCICFWFWLCWEGLGPCSQYFSLCYSNTSWPNQVLRKISKESFVTGLEIQLCCVMPNAGEWVRRNRECMRDRGSACTRLWESSADYRVDEGSPGACTFLILDQRNSLEQAEVSSLLQIRLILM